MPELLLAIDVGTTNLRVCLFDAGGAMLIQSQRAVRTTSPGPGLVEQDANGIWRGVRSLIGKTLLEGGHAVTDLAAIGVTTQRTSAVIWDRATGKPLTPLVVWSDLRGVARAAELQALGIGLSPQQAAAKLGAMVAQCQDTPKGRLAFGNIDSFLIWKLSGGGAHITDRSQAWPMGYLDLKTLNWNTGLMALQGLDPGLFPTLADSYGQLSVTSAKVFGAAIPICADLADQQSALIGQGCDASGAAKVSFGTSATLNVSTGGSFLYPGPSTPPFVLSSVGGDTRFCLEGMVFSAGSGLDWLRARFGLGDHRRFEALAASVGDTGGTYVLPAYQGLGSPRGDHTRRGLIGGLGLATGPAEIARAGLEGLAFRVTEVFQHIYAVTDLAVPEVLKVDGGLTGNDTLMQIQADLLARCVWRATGRASRSAWICIRVSLPVRPPSTFNTSGAARSVTA